MKADYINMAINFSILFLLIYLAFGINDLRRSLSRALSGDANMIRRENESLRYALSSMPEFSLLQVIQKNRRSTYDELANCTGLTKTKLRNYTKELLARGHVTIDKKTRPHQIVYLSTPWSTSEPEVQCTLEPISSTIQYEPRIERS